MKINKYLFLNKKKYIRINLKKFVSEEQCLDTTAFALNSGADVVELSAEGLNFKKQEAFVEKMRELASVFEAVFLISSRVDVAQAFCADGVVTQGGDLSPHNIRRIAGENFIVGQKLQKGEDVLDDVDFLICQNDIPKTDKPVFCERKLADFFKELPKKAAFELTPELLEH